MAHDRSGPEGRVSVEDLLAEPLLRSALVLEGDIGRTQVAWCLPWSEINVGGARSKNDLAGVAVHVSTTAIRDPSGACSVVGEVADRAGSALLAWPPDSDPMELAAASSAARERGLPLVVLPCAADYPAVSRLVGQKALAQTAHVLEYSMRVHRTLAEVLSRGAGIPAMAQAITGLARSPVLVLGAAGEVIASAVPPGAWNADPSSIAVPLAERLGEIPLEGDEQGHGPPTHGIVLESGGGEEWTPAHVLSAPIMVAGEVYGWLAVAEGHRPPERHDLAQHRIIVEHGATLIGSEMLRQWSMRTAEERTRGDFIYALVHGRFADEHELRARARHQEFDIEGRYAVHIVASSALIPSDRSTMQRGASMARIAQTLDPPGDRPRLATVMGTMLVVIDPLPSGPDSLQGDEEDKTITRFAQRLHRAFSRRLGSEVRVSYGRCGLGAAGVSTSYYEARVAMGLARRLEADPVCGYSELRVFAVLRDLGGSRRGRAFVDEVLTPLRDVHSQTGDLEQVVLAYIRSGGNLNAAARSMRLHRNTMLYKLERASRVLGRDLRSADTQFMVWLAHHIDTLGSIASAIEQELAPPANDVFPH
ncbi:sugar diacid utilization regulator [Spinactinospora alkalitolerans]|uniref:Sugar diacid utilization regulator n=1 Tax=Spinactinospora alkalitolerans TaxID=687207 RepID=A0A852TYB0_9ACTN|nr:helix-turn-helix domain-containing protein [Spinactinospora alkalitolerans]NYE47972.1 sugar diacid utilization regulator [Spinactinospora alkalitolerans]